MNSSGGGDPAFSPSELGRLWPIYGNEEQLALKRVLESRVWCRIKETLWNQGEVAEFESQFRVYLRTKHFLAVSNGTVAIELALAAMGVGPGDEVLVPACTFFATVTPVLRAGAVPVFVDVQRASYLMDPDCLESRVTEKSRAVIVVHLSGLPVDLDRINSICQAHGIGLIEDCAQATGSTWRGRRVGTVGRIGCFSFQQDKVLQCGEGGGVATDDDALAGRLFAFHQGFHVPGAPTQAKHEVSSNMRMTPWQGAILKCQLARLDEQIQRREENFVRFVGLLKVSDPLRPVSISEGTERWSIYSVPLRYDSHRMGGLSRDEFILWLQAQGVPASAGHTDPVYRRPLFLENRLVYRNDGCPVGEHIADEHAVTISHRFFLGPTEWMEKLIEVVRAYQLVMNRRGQVAS